MALNARWNSARACDDAWLLEVCMSDARGNYVACLAGPLTRATWNLRLKLQNWLTVCDMMRKAT
jgi:hypothetical protein